MIKIALIDQQQIFREGMKRLFEAEGRFELIVSSNDLLKNNTNDIFEQVDLLLLDIKTLKKNERVIQDSFLAGDTNKKVVVLSSEGDENFISEAILLGVHGYLLKEMSFEAFTNAIESIMNGGIYIHPHVTKDFVADYRSIVLMNGATPTSLTKIKKPIHLCTKRECEILQLLTDGKNNQGIAKKLNISEKTVKNHISNIFRKIDVRDRTQAVVLAIRNEWVEL